MEEIKLKTLYVCDSCGKHSHTPEATCNCKEIWNIGHFCYCTNFSNTNIINYYGLFIFSLFKEKGGRKNGHSGCFKRRRL